MCCILLMIMEIRKTKIIGFCGGVRRAIKIAEEHPNSYIVGGAIIHNPYENKRLEKDFNIISKEINDIPNNSIAIISAHGLGFKEQLSMKNRNIKLIDTTCPKVLKVQKIAQQLIDEKYNVFLFGKKEHAEIKGIIGQVNKDITVFASIEELNNVDIPDKVALISQTTKPIGEFKQVEDFLKTKCREFKSVCTICSATQNNQIATIELASWADIMIVIGGKTSANTKALVATSKKFCSFVYHIEDKTELNKEWFYKKERCGITAGLSTPDYSISEVEESIKNLI